MSLFAELGGPGGYVLLLVVTFAAHALLVGFVLGAAAWATARALVGGDDPVAAAARDWLPFALGAAITAGVAPLLLIQVLYQHRVYTATLLMSHRFMAIVPALIAGFYLLYLGKSVRARAWSGARRGLVSGAALLAFLFVAWSWIEEHTLAAAGAETWVAHYRDGRVFHRDPVIAVRLALWLGLAAVAFATGAAWLAGARAGRAELRRLGGLGLTGLAVAAAAAVGTVGGRAGELPAMATPWLVLAGSGAAVTAAGMIALAGGRGRAGRRLATVGAVALFLAVAALREVDRAHAIEWRATLDGAQGLPLFVVCLLLATGAIAWCARLVRRHLDERAG